MLCSKPLASFVVLPNTLQNGLQRLCISSIGLGPRSARPVHY
ncbi:hypothetical protein PDIG_03580 [Penicillium digitatum PHI26]|uniref:Uncharacterized protein n=2 Tax=Penicillium digitatum TaxID=36651 RepID=K9GX60_PEND2|nr:hypothetical protein PDIP_08260 [Penicillium digitatum Pd1]EKV19198.1 hypothetical protein PDIG_03580 [Penicillium digitatum PHI26]EKV21253.1 hypothetical protein PDIP_08260 [Penicillium digitatum Pd1]